MVPGPLHRMMQQLRRIAGGPTNATDRELLEQYAAIGDQEAFTALVQRHGPLVLGVCRRLLHDEHDAEDAFQAAFILLAKKAGAVRWRDSVSNWLYESAYRIASKLRVKSARRRKHEQQAPPPLPSDDSNAVDWRELCGVLDEELYRMPELFRLPLLLCYLHGKTRDEAAEQLGWSVGTVKGRLERGREMLRQRLTRRGLTLPAALLPLLLGQEANAGLPTALVSATVEGAITDTMAAPVAALVKGALQAMFWMKMKWAASVLAVLVLLASGTGVALHRAMASARPLGEKDVPRTETGDKAREPAWGEPRDGVRLGLAPGQLSVDPAAREIKVTVWYQNVGKDQRHIPLHSGANLYRLLFKGQKDGKDFLVSYAVARNRTAGPQMVPLLAGQKQGEHFVVPFNGPLGSGWSGLPALDAGKSLTLQVGLCPNGDPTSDKDWNATDTLKSSTITLTCDARAEAKS